MKITIVGDIMCEPAILNAARQTDGSYDFTPMFAQVREMFAQADYVIANFETPMAGEAAGYTGSYYVFNSPDSYADAVKQAGIDFVSTANNHVFDRGMPGLVRTLEVLDAKGIAHSGTSAPGEPRQGAYFTECGGVKLALVAYTYSTNYEDDPADPRCVLAEGTYEGTVNLLRSQRESVYLPGVWRGDDRIDRLTKRFIPDEEARGRLKVLLGLPGNYARADDNLHPETMAPYMRQLTRDIQDAKRQADVVIVCPHVGGQFNPTPGAITRHVVDTCLAAGADAVMAGHAHCIHKMERRGSVPVAYSLGNFSMNPNSSLMVPERLPAYALAVHLYVEGGKITKTTFSILKAVMKKQEQLVSWPVDRLYATLKTARERQALEAEVREVYRIVTGKTLSEDAIRREYAL